MNIIIVFLLVTGSVFILISSIGLLRMPDFYTRLSTTTKANTIGIGSMMLALALFFIHDISLVTRSFTAIIFIFITIPVSGHFLGRVAYFIGIPKWKGNKKDDLIEKFGISKSGKD